MEDSAVDTFDQVSAAPREAVAGMEEDRGGAEDIQPFIRIER